jgi:hypothetical protein
VGKPKDIWQIAWELGLLDPTKTYVAKINNADPNFEENVEYRTVLADSLDLINEKICLMYLGKNWELKLTNQSSCIQNWPRKESDIVGAKQKECIGKLNYATRRERKTSRALSLAASPIKRRRIRMA